MQLDKIDTILLRRCLDALDGTVQISTALVEATPISGILRHVLHAAQTNQPSSKLTRKLAILGQHEEWRELLDPLHQIITGSRDPALAEGLSPGNAAVVTMLIELLN
jgi:hypothetical protein